VPSPQSVVPNAHFTVSDMLVDTGEQLTGGADDAVTAIPYVPGGEVVLVTMVTLLEAMVPFPTVTCEGENVTDAFLGAPAALRLTVTFGPAALTVRVSVSLPPRCRLAEARPPSVKLHPGQLLRGVQLPPSGPQAV
jgi:hypothetical protein